MATYSEKLRDPRWQKKRLEILDRDKFTCQVCGSTEETLHVHHRIYKNNFDPWEYENNLLVTLCEHCHEYESRSIKEYSDLLINTLKSKGFYADNLRELASGINELKMDYPSEVMASIYSFAFKDEKLSEFIKEYFWNDLAIRREKIEKSTQENNVR